MFRTNLSIAANLCILYYQLCVIAYYQGKRYSRMKRMKRLP